MTTLSDLIAQREQLDKQIAEARQRELSNAINKVRALMAEYGLSPSDIFGNDRGASKRGMAGSQGVTKYRDTATGKTWSGRGKPPQWISGKDRNQFLIG